MYFVPVSYRDGIVTLHLHDTAGLERFYSLPPSYLRGAHGVFIVYDVTNPRAIVEVDTWVERVRQECDESARVILIGNKVDKERNVSRRWAEDYAEENHMEYIETSAKTMENVEMMFEHMKEKLLEGLSNSDFSIVTSVVSIKQSQPQNQTQSKCCF